MTTDVTYLGMDLGSFKTSVACCNGRREMFATAVGWPKDHVAEATMGSSVVFGKEIRRRRLILDIVRPFEYGVIKYNEVDRTGTGADEVARRNEAARLIVAHAVSLMEPEPGLPVYGVIGAPSRASVANKQSIVQAARSAFDAVAVVPEPFAIAFSMGDVDEALVVDIGAGTIDICPVFGKYPSDEEQVTIGVAGDSVDEQLHQILMHEHPGARLSREMVRDLKEKYGFVHEPHKPVVVELPTDDAPREFDLTVPLFEACRSIVAPIVEGVREVLRKVDPEYRQHLRGNVLLGGGGSQLRGLDQELEKALRPYGGGTVRKVYDCAFAGAAGALKLAMSMPADNWEHIKSLGQHVPAA